MNKKTIFKICTGILFIAATFLLYIINVDEQDTFAKQLGGLSFMVGSWFLLWNLAKKNPLLSSITLLIGISLLHSISAPDANIPYGTFMASLVALLVIFWSALRIAGRTYLASFFGACLFACSTWLPLSFISIEGQQEILSLRDALIDPNQISVSHSAGGYIGIAGALFAITGVGIWLVMVIQKRLVLVQAETIFVILLIVSMALTFIPSPLTYPKAIIVVVASLAWLASFGLDRLQRFLGLNDAFAQTLLIILFSISLLDLMHIASHTMRYGIGI